ncbi:energy transducer TonB, partial [Paracidovorax avenae]|uniref:energy transducer TonB n=1 Tax=Paracidovorax avenae TaxID=80867 RepID=UPI000D216789
PVPPAPAAPPAPAPSPAPPAPPAPAPAPAAPAMASVELVCSNYADVRQAVGYPSRARRQGLEGTVVAEFNVSPSGSVENLRIASASSDLFAGPVLEAMRELRCKGQGMPVRVRVPFSFSLK